MPTLWEWESRFLILLKEMQETGIKIDREFCTSRYREGLETLEKLRAKLGWNPSSNKDLIKHLIEELGFPVVKRTPSGAPSFDKFAMEEYEHLMENMGTDVVKDILSYRGWQKTVSSNYKAYLELADSNDILHPEYMLHGTRTSRLSCRKPNLQQIPRSSPNPWNGDLKRAFIPRLPGYRLINFDYAQLELRLTAAVTKEPVLLDAFHSDIDVFDAMSEELGWSRNDVKKFTYMTLYGAGVGKVALTFGLSHPDARAMIHDFFRRFRKLRDTIDKAQQIVAKKGYLEYWTGRRRHLPFKEERHKSFNSYVQGGGAEIVKRSLLRLWDEVPKGRLVLTVHDSVTLELPEEQCTKEYLGKINSILEAIPEAEEMGVPFKVEWEEWGVE